MQVGDLKLCIVSGHMQAVSKSRFEALHIRRSELNGQWPCQAYGYLFHIVETSCPPFSFRSPILLLVRNTSTYERQLGEDIGHTVQPDKHHKLHHHNNYASRSDYRLADIAASEPRDYKCTFARSFLYYNNHHEPMAFYYFETHIGDRDP